MKKKKIFSRLAAVVLAAVTVIACTASYASASVIDLTKQGTINLTMKNAAAQEVPGGTMAIYQVAGVTFDANGNTIYSYTNGFENCGVSLDKLDDSTLASQLEAKITSSMKYNTGNIDDHGTVTFSNLPLGLYLLKQTQAAQGYNLVSSFLVSVPSNTDGTYVYTVDASPKVQAAPVLPPDQETNVSGTPTPSPTVSPTVTPSGGSSDEGGGGGSSDASSHSGSSSTLPQTGQLDWPIPVLAIAGIIFFAIGWSLKKEKRKDEQA